MSCQTSRDCTCIVLTVRRNIFLSKKTPRTVNSAQLNPCNRREKNILRFFPRNGIAQAREGQLLVVNLEVYRDKRLGSSQDGVWVIGTPKQHHRISKPFPRLYKGNDSDVARPCPSLCHGINEDVQLIHMYRYVGRN